MQYQNALEIIKRAQQLIVVVTESWQDIEGRLWFFNKKNDHNWLAVKLGIPIVVGKKGLAWADDSFQKIAETDIKQEGDNKAPAGVMQIGKSFGFGDRDLKDAEYVNIATGIECIDDSNSKYYNQIINTNKVEKDWQSSEKMSEILLYKYGVEILYNKNPAKPRKGSCIFMHEWRSQEVGTEGCTAMAQKDIKDITQLLDLNKNPVLIQLPKDIYDKLQELWCLPNLFQGN
ncbi:MULTISPECIES: L,D-transpeptidase family protein [unclassified Francisella]|uniref:L,D-transpeptidase family protein n=1 Tax=unclassified Francisella TaxID=2610885 RepID=UPI002E34FE09|nr:MULTISPECIES: L,D-transpeptidase family protein [unclassified Francisella]MED7819674.1 L,D-transpeptidase family protein [Francisella sp. 19S2-4]MED7830504.1 L,D-transpeptidase family protein [Francisella sp. 19S2-10]